MYLKPFSLLFYFVTSFATFYFHRHCDIIIITNNNILHNRLAKKNKSEEMGHIAKILNNSITFAASLFAILNYIIRCKNMQLNKNNKKTKCTSNNKQS